MARRPKPKKVQKDAVVNLRLTVDQKARFTEAAEKAGMDLSTFLRVAAIEKIDRAGP